jgi:septal ring factor EnvC (AmiA/AmiB activator)
MWKILKNRKAQKNKLDFFELTKRAVSLTGQFKGRSDKELKSWIEICERYNPELEGLACWVAAIELEDRRREDEAIEKLQKQMKELERVTKKPESIAPDARSIEELEATAELAINQFAKRSHKELKDWIDECEERIKALERLQETEGDSRPTSKWMLINEKTGEVIVKMDNVKFSAPFPDRLIC